MKNVLLAALLLISVIALILGRAALSDNLHTFVCGPISV